MENMVTELTAADYPAVLELWEASVRATHTFLKPEEIDFYKPFVLKYALPDCRLHGIKTNKGSLKAFIGLSEDKVEMLFVRPDCFRNGCGRRLMTFAEREKGIRKVDVNEENPQALAFYLRMGFKISGRSELDGNGKPHPLLLLQKD